MPLSELASPERVAGKKQVSRLLAKGKLAKIFIAEDADIKGLEHIITEAEQQNVSIEYVGSKLFLGRACAISRSASVAGLRLKGK